MSYVASGFKTLTEIGTVDGTAGSYRAFHAYVTNDDAPTVETANYFDTLIASGAARVKTGDVIMCVLDQDGSPLVRHYAVTVSGGHVTLAKASSGSYNGLTIIPLYTSLADIAAADLFSYTPGFPFKLEAMDFVVDKPATTSGKAATLTPKIAGNAVTGGVVSLTSAAATPQAAKVAGTTITAGNVGGATDAITVTGSSVTAFAEGNGWLMLKLRNLDG